MPEDQGLPRLFAVVVVATAALLAGLATVQGFVLALAIPPLVLVGWALWQAPRRLNLDVRRHLDQDRVAQGEHIRTVLTVEDREEALDETQETFITVLRKAGSFEGRSAFSTWLYRVAVNTCYTMLRKKGRRPTAPLPEAHDPPDLSASDRFRSAELRPMLEDALATLPEEFGPAVLLSDLEGLPLQSVAEILEIPLGTVKSRVFRGRKLLAAHLGNLMAASGYPKEDEA